MTRKSLFVQELERLVEKPLVQTPVKPMSPQDELQLLEKKALERGMKNQKFEEIQKIGNCPVQVQTRIELLHQWLAAH